MGGNRSQNIRHVSTPGLPGFDKATSADYDKTTKIAGNESMELQKPGFEVVCLS